MDREKQILRLLNTDGLLLENRSILERWDRECDKNENVAPSTRAMQLYKLVPLAIAIKKPFKEMDRKDLEDFLYSLEIETGTLDQYKIFIKKFFKWLYQSDTFPDVVKWVKVANHKKRMLPDDILTPAEIKALLEAADNLRDKAFISFVYESAARIEEAVVHEKKGKVIIPVKQKDLVFDQYGCVIVLNGKTGKRRVRLIQCVPDLLLYLNNHPRRGDNEPLWVTRDPPYDALSASRAYSLIVSVAEKSSVEKNVYPHLLRHTRLTKLAGILTEADLKVVAGWAPDSKMASVYVHRSGRDVDMVMLEAEGIVTKEEACKESDVLKARTCPRCKESNPSTAKFCYRCGMALDMETAAKIDKENSGIALEMFDLLKQHPRLLDILKRFEESVPKDGTNGQQKT